jgi:hypothetical protein
VLNIQGNYQEATMPDVSPPATTGNQQPQEQHPEKEQQRLEYEEE